MHVDGFREVIREEERMSQTPHKCLETVITFRASRDLVKTLTKRAQERHITRSTLIRDMLKNTRESVGSEEATSVEMNHVLR